MKTSDNGINFLVLEEGLRLKPYLDSRGKPTIGIGSTFYEDGTPVRITDKPISRIRAIQLFQNVLKKFEQTLNAYIFSHITQNQFDALISLVYNIGTTAFRDSTVRRLVNLNPKNPAITDAFLMWKSSAGKPILLERRKREAKLYFK
jgi:lysozyme